MYNPLNVILDLLDPRLWACVSTELAKASPLLMPVYWYLLDWINAHHQTANPRMADLHQFISLELTLLVFCGYQFVKPYLRKAL